MRHRFPEGSLAIHGWKILPTSGPAVGQVNFTILSPRSCMLTSSLQELDFDEDRAPRCMKSILLLNSVLTKSRSSDLAGVHQQGIARNETSFAISLCILI